MGNESKMRVWRTLLLLTALIAPGSPGASTVTTPPPRLCAAYSDADAVVTARVTAFRFSADGQQMIWHARRISSHKGSVASHFRIVVANDSGRPVIDAGRIMLLFLRRHGEYWTAGGDDPNASGSERLRIEQQLGRLRDSRDATTGSVLVRVTDGALRPLARASLRLTARGVRARTFTTDERGMVEARLPPGHWSAAVTQLGWYGRQSVYGYQNPRGFELAAGGCADIYIEAVRRPPAPEDA